MSGEPARATHLNAPPPRSVQGLSRFPSLVPASEMLAGTSRRCVLISPSNRPMRPIVREIREWIIAQLRADVEAIDLLCPQLGLLAAGY